MWLNNLLKPFYIVADFDFEVKVVKLANLVADSNEITHYKTKITNIQNDYSNKADKS